MTWRDPIRPRRLAISMPSLVTGAFLDQIPASAPEAPTGAFDLPTRVVTANGTPLHCFEFGEGDVAVFVHGSLGDYRSWANQFEAFAAAGFRVITYSRRYHYPNRWTGDGNDYSTALHTADLAAFVQALECGPVHLVGQSTGATIAARCASHHPEIVRTLVINEPDHAPWLLEADSGASLLEDYLSQVDRPMIERLKSGDKEGAIRLFVDGVLGQGTFDALPPPLRAMSLQNIPELEAEVRCADRFYSPFTRQDVEQIAAPTLFIEGGRTLPIFRVIANAFCSWRPHTARAVVEGSHHAVHVAAPEQFASLALAFLRQFRRAGR